MIRIRSEQIEPLIEVLRKLNDSVDRASVSVSQATIHGHLVVSTEDQFIYIEPDGTER